MITAIKEFHDQVGKKVTYWLPVLFFAVLAFGFAITNRTVSIDDLAYKHYMGGNLAMLAATRWGGYIWGYLTTLGFMPFVARFLSICFSFAGAYTFSAAAHHVFGRISLPAHTIFACAWVTYPLFNEIYEYGGGMSVNSNFLLVAGTILFMLTWQGKPWKKMLIASLPLTLVVSSYESMAFVYVSAVFLFLFIRHGLLRQGKTKAAWLKEGCSYIPPLVLGVILRIVIGVLLIRIFGLEYASNGATEVGWDLGSRSILKYIYVRIINLIATYVINGLVYLPIFIFAVSALVFVIWVIVVCVKQRRILPGLLGVLLLASLFLQSALQDSAMPYRTAQTIDFFAAFVMAAMVELAVRSGKKGIRIAVLAAGLFVCLQQSIYMSQLLALNNQRSDNELDTVRQIGYRLKTEFEDKPVVFVGKYDLGDWIEEQIQVDINSPNGRLYQAIWKYIDPNEDIAHKEFVTTNVNSLLEWGSSSTAVFWTDYNMMEECFSYCGYDIDVLTYKDWDEYDLYIQAARDAHIKPLEIRDMGQYILVCLGDLPA